MSKYSVMIAEEDADIDAELPGTRVHIHVEAVRCYFAQEACAICGR